MIKVSVCIVTYNHEKFIAQALDSALMQEADFDYEIILGEDESQDGTRQICIEYARRYPDRIRLFLRSRKDVIYINGQPTGRFNFVENLKAARGEYIALLDGDDYWTDPHKLQKQVDHLDSHPEQAICCHDVMEVYENRQTLPHRFCPPNQKDTATLEDLLAGFNVPAPSVLFRRGLFGEFPAWFFQAPIGDIPLHVLNAQHGEIGYLNEVMAVHRAHEGGVWSRLDPVDAQITNLELYSLLASVLPAEYRSVIYRRSIEFLKRIGEELAVGLENDSIEMVDINAAEQKIRGVAEEYHLGKGAQRVALRAFFAHLLFNRKVFDNKRALQHIIVQAIRFDLSLLKNTGVWSIAIEVFAGGKITWLLRQAARRSLLCL